MKKILLAAFALTGLTAGAQYLPNQSFELWKGDKNCGNSIQASSTSLTGPEPTSGTERKRPGNEPTDWNGSSINQQVGMKKEETLVFLKNRGTDTAPNYYVELENKYVGVAMLNIGANAPAYLTFGTPWAYACSSSTDQDGGTFGGVQFKHRPDAIKGLFKRTVGTEKPEEAAHIIAYFWKGTFVSNIGKATDANKGKISTNDVDRAIMGKSNAGPITGDGVLIAQCDYSFNTTNDWEEIVVPINYVSGQENVIPEKMNVIISSADYWNRSNIGKENILDVDDVQFVYYHALQNVSYDGTALTFDANNYCDLSSVDYDATKTLTYTKVGVGATVEDPVYNEQTCQLTITVKGNDFEANAESYTTYTIQFAKPVDVTKVIGAYSSELLIDMNLGGTSTPAPGVRVSLTEGTEPNTVNFELRNFDMGDGTMLGDIVLPNIRLLDKGNNTYGFGENAPVPLTLLEGEINATATLNIETSSVVGDNLTAYVDVIWLIKNEDDTVTEWPINVNAIGPKIYPLTITDGEAINAKAGAYDVTLTRSFAKGWSTLCLPFDVNPAEFGVEGVKVQEFSAATGNSLDFKAVETITANVPYLIYFPEAVNAGVTLLTKIITSLDAQAVQKGEYTFKGSYEGSISMSGKYGVADVNGVQKIMRGGSNSTLKCTRAYFEYNGTDNVQGMRLNLEGGNVTGIDGITTGDTDAETPLYDLSGRRVQNATKGGIYIRNGKKIIK